MKKVLLSAFAAAFVCGAHAEEATLDIAALDGFYLGGGLGLYDGGVRTETTAVSNPVNAAEIGLDTNDHATELMLSLVAGWGKVFKEKFYFGLEAGADFARNNNFHHEGMGTRAGVNLRVFSVDSRINGIIPMVALRFGYVACNTMTYLKAGAFWTKAKTHYTDVGATGELFYGSGSVSKLTPFVALGCEKAINAKMRCRLEAEYRIRTHNDFTYHVADGVDSNFTVKVENKDAFAVRAYVVRSFALGN